MYNTNEAIAKQAGQAASLHVNTFGCSSGPSPDHIPMSAQAADLVSGLMDLNGSLRTLRAQLFGEDPKANGAAKQSGPSSLGQAVYLAGMELCEAHAQINTILNRL